MIPEIIAGLFFLFLWTTLFMFTNVTTATLISFILLVFTAIIVGITYFISRIYLIKLRRNYNEEKDSSRKSGRLDDAINTDESERSGYIEKPIGNTELVESIEQRTDVSNVSVATTGTDDHVSNDGTEKVKRSHRRLLKRRRRRR